MTTVDSDCQIQALGRQERDSGRVGMSPDLTYQRTSSDDCVIVEALAGADYSRNVGMATGMSRSLVGADRRCLGRLPILTCDLFRIAR
jgi:hypothetical protein